MIRQLGSQLKRALLRRRIRFLSRRSWRLWHDKVFELHAEYRRPAPKAAEKEHLRIWQQLRPDVSLRTLRACYNMSGAADPRMVPEEVFTSEIESALNRHDFCYFLDNKSFLSRWLPQGSPPQTYLHNIDGEFYSGDYEPLGGADVDRLLGGLEYPVVIKPSMGSSGRGVSFPGDRAALERCMEGRRDFLVQCKVKQHPFFNRYSHTSLNTVRVCVYRSVADSQMHVLNAVMRMGVGGQVDNVHAGGIHCLVHDDGTLDDVAVDNWGGRVLRHPITGVDFAKGGRLPKYDELKGLAKRLAQDVYFCRLVSFDFCMDSESRWRLVEVNLRNQTIQMAQYAGRPFFEPFTDEVIEYCKQHPRWTILLPP